MADAFLHMVFLLIGWKAGTERNRGLGLADSGNIVQLSFYAE